MILAEIATLGAQSRLSLAKGVKKASAHVASLEGAEILDRSADVKSIAQTADLVHGWKERRIVLHNCDGSILITLQSQTTDSVTVEIERSIF